jgi:hypothetical protein
MPRIDWLRSARDCDRMPITSIFFTAPLSMPRSSTSASAAGPSTMVGARSPRRACCSVRV